MRGTPRLKPWPGNMELRRGTGSAVWRPRDHFRGGLTLPPSCQHSPTTPTFFTDLHVFESHQRLFFMYVAWDVNYSLVYNDVRERENTHVYSHLAYDTDMRETLNVNKWEINFHIEKRKRKRILPSPNFSF